MKYKVGDYIECRSLSVWGGTITGFDIVSEDGTEDPQDIIHVRFTSHGDETVDENGWCYRNEILKHVPFHQNLDKTPPASYISNITLNMLTSTSEPAEPASEYPCLFINKVSGCIVLASSSVRGIVVKESPPDKIGNPYYPSSTFEDKDTWMRYSGTVTIKQD